MGRNEGDRKTGITLDLAIRRMNMPFRVSDGLQPPPPFTTSSLVFSPRLAYYSALHFPNDFYIRYRKSVLTAMRFGFQFFFSLMTRRITMT